nr:MAG TPA: hypothetical protein [Caudoviricetes sp.]
MLRWLCVAQSLRVMLAPSRSYLIAWSFVSVRGGATSRSLSLWIVSLAVSSPRWSRSPWRVSCVTSQADCTRARRRTATATS